MDRQKISNLTSRKNSIEGTILKLKANLNLLSDEESRKRGREIGLTTDINTKTSSKTTLDNFIAEVKSQKRLAQTHLARISSEIHEAEGEWSVLESVSNDTKTKISKINNALCAEASSHNRTTKVIDLSRNKLFLENDLSKIESQISSLQYKLTAKFQEKRRFELQTSTLKIKLNSLIRDSTTVTDELNQCKGRYQCLMSESSNRKKKIRDMTSELRQKEIEKATLETDLFQLLNQHTSFFKSTTTAFSNGSLFSRKSL